jgi:hypothetical protein
MSVRIRVGSAWADVSNRSEAPYVVLRRKVNRPFLLLTVLFVLLPMGGPAAASRLDLGFYDGVFVADDRDPWLERAGSIGAEVIRLDIGWPASRAPRDPADPADPAYDFSRADASIRAIAGAGLVPDLSFTGAPTWAEGSDRPQNAPGGSWKPDIHAVRAYAVALGRRYSGTYPDPAYPGRVLPRVTYFQVWNEPNLSKYLSPQWVRGRNGVTAYAPVHYRRMLNAFSDGLRSVRSDSRVITAGTAPFGDNIGGDRIRPLRFWRALLSKPTKFDIAAHHPYGVAVPTRAALNADDITVPDLGKLRRLLDAKDHPGPLWVTEVSFDSSPPDPDGVPIARHARWLSQTMYVLWKARVDTVLWYLIRDSPPIPSYPESNQAGVFYFDGSPKPAETAFRFPFVVVPQGSQVIAWSRSPASGRLVVERRRADRWTPVASRRVSKHQIVQFRLRDGGRDVFRARVGPSTSLSFSAPQFGH